MSERRRHPVAALVVVLAALVPSGGGLGRDRDLREAVFRSRLTTEEGKQRRHPLAAVLIGMVTLLVTVGLGLAAFWAVVGPPFSSEESASPYPIWWLCALLAGLAALTLVGGLWWAFTIGLGSWRLRSRAAGSSPSM